MCGEIPTALAGEESLARLMRQPRQFRHTASPLPVVGLMDDIARPCNLISLLVRLRTISCCPQFVAGSAGKFVCATMSGRHMHNSRTTCTDETGGCWHSMCSLQSTHWAVGMSMKDVLTSGLMALFTGPHQTSFSEPSSLTTRLSSGERPVLEPEYAVRAPVEVMAVPVS